MSQSKYGEGKQHEAEDEHASGSKPGFTPPANLPTSDAWRVLQGSLNSLSLAQPLLVISGVPGPETLAAAKGLVPLIEYVIKQQQP